jgi:predicted Zn-dependent peptidase
LVVEPLYAGASSATLDSGLRILAEEIPGSRSVSMGVWVGCGGRDDGPSCAGLSHFLEHLAFKGTPRRDAAEISREIDSIGGQLNGATAREWTVYYADVPANGTFAALDLLADLVCHPAYAPDSIDVERAVVLEEIRGHEDDPEQSAFDRFAAGLWKNTHPLSRPVLGTREAIEHVSRETISAHHSRFYRPENTVLAACGAVKPHSLFEQVARLFPDGTRAHARMQRTPPVFRHGRYHHERDFRQTHIYVGLPGPASKDEDRYALGVTNAILGDGTSSRLFRSIREDRGLAYAIGSAVTRYTDGGVWLMYAATAPTVAPTVTELVLEELRRLRVSPIQDDEIDLAKARLRGSFILGLEANANRATRLGTAAIADVQIRSPDDVLAKLDAVSAEDIARVIGRFDCAETINVTTVGPAR